MLSTSHPAKFSEAVTLDVAGLLNLCSLKSTEGCWKKRGVGDVDEPNKELVKKVIGFESAGNGASEAGSSTILGVICQTINPPIFLFKGQLVLLGYIMPFFSHGG